MRRALVSTDLVDDVFLLSDDDYRPLRPINESFFHSDGRDVGYYFHDLGAWSGSGTPFCDAQHVTNDVLSYLGAPRLAYGSHMPQIVRKSYWDEAFSLLDELRDDSMICEWASAAVIVHAPTRLVLADEIARGPIANAYVRAVARTSGRAHAHFERAPLEVPPTAAPAGAPAFEGWRRRMKDELVDEIQRLFTEAELALRAADSVEARTRGLQRFVEALNRLDQRWGGFMETLEREQACAHIDALAASVGLPPDMADRWREW